MRHLQSLFLIILYDVNAFLKDTGDGDWMSLLFDLTSNHQTDTYEKNNQLQGVSNHDISLSRKEM